MSKQAKNGLVPELRFPEFRKRGEWEEVPLDRVVTIHKGKGIAKSDISPNGKLLCIRYGELYTRYGEVIDEVSSRTDVDPSELFLSEAGDVIIPASGETKEDIATASCVLHDGVALGSDLNVLRSDANGPFLSYYINHSKKRAIANVAQGDAVVHLYPHQLNKLTLTIPKPDEQQKIAACLSSLDALLAAEREKLEALRAHKKGLMQQLFPAEGEKVPKRRFPGFGGEWVEKKLGDGLTDHPQYGMNAPATSYAEDLPTYLRITDISEDGRFLSAGKVSVDREASEDEYMKDGDIALARTGASVGKSYKYRKADGRLVYAGFLIRVRPHPKMLDSEYLNQFLSTGTYWKWVNFISARSGQPGINGNEYASMPLPMPPTTKEQKEIAACLSSLDDRIALQDGRVEMLVEHKKGLMQGLFPG